MGLTVRVLLEVCELVWGEFRLGLSHCRCGEDEEGKAFYSMI